MRRHPLTKEFEPSLRTRLGFSGEHDDGVGLFRPVHYQDASRLAREGEKDNQNHKQYSEGSHF